MQENPYKSPKSNLEDRKESPFTSIRGLFLGVLVDIGGTFAGVVIISIGFSILWASSGMDTDQIFEKFDSMGFLSLPNLLSHAWGLSMSYFGGYVSVTTSNTNNYRIPIVVAAISMIYSLTFAPDSMEFLLALILTLIAFSCTLYGARAAFHKRMPPSSISN